MKFASYAPVIRTGARQSVEVGLVLFYVTWDKLSVLQ